MQSERDDKGRFLTGSNGGPGRRVGSRGRLGADFIDALHEKFQAHGSDCLDRMIKNEPTQFIKVVKDLLPREVVIAALHVNSGSALSELASEAARFAEAWRIIKRPMDDPLLELEAERRDAEVFDDD